MRKNLMLPICIGLALLAWLPFAQADCPEDPNDHGACDTVYAELYSPDALFTGPGHLARAPVFVTNDLVDPTIDSIGGMVIPLCYTHTNPAAYCSIPRYWNNPPSYIPGQISILRDLDDTTLNAFGQLYPYPRPEDFYLDISTTDQHFWFSFVPAGMSGARWRDGSRQLAFIMTFKVEDTMTVCVDSCFWPPSSHLLFSRSDAVTYTPRDNMPSCFSILSPDIGDCNCDGVVDIGDVVYLVGYLYRGGPPPPATAVGDANCDGVADIGDVVRLIGYLYKGEPPPSC